MASNYIFSGSVMNTGSVQGVHIDDIAWSSGPSHCWGASLVLLFWGGRAAGKELPHSTEESSHPPPYLLPSILLLLSAH